MRSADGDGVLPPMAEPWPAGKPQHLQGVKVRQAARNGERKEAPLLVPAAEVGGVVRPMQQVKQGVPWPEF